MKKLSKILVLLLAVIAILTAFTVTILAAEGTEENKGHSVDSITAWESNAVGARITNGHDWERQGYICLGLGQNGEEKYVLITPGKLKSATISGGYMWDIGLTRTNPKPKEETASGVETYEHNFKDYAYIVTDFDICSPTGSFGNLGNGNIFVSNYRAGVNNSNSGSFVYTWDFSKFKSYLDASEYNWQHVSLVAHLTYTLDSTTGKISTAKYDTYVYVDGVYKTHFEQVLDSSAYFIGKDPEALGYYSVRIANSSDTGTWNLDYLQSIDPDFTSASYNKADITTFPGYVKLAGLSDTERAQYTLANGYHVVDIAADKETETVFDYAFISSEYWFKESLALDNIDYHYYQSGWSHAEIAADLYNAETYEFPFGLATATLNGVLYDDLSKAVALANNGETIYLNRDVTETVNVNKKIFIDTRKYVDGVATSDCYTANFASDYEQENDNGVITFKEPENYVDVYWDPCDTCSCDSYVEHGDECDCTCFEDDANHPGHILGLAGTAVLGSTLVYPGEIPTFDIVDGKSIKFAGWSREFGGEVLETITVTEDDIDAGELLLYPVYEIAVYSLEVITKDGTVTYHSADEFADLLVGASSGTTVKLIRDLDVTNVGVITLSTQVTITLDLNGYDLNYANIYGNMYRYSTGETTDELIKVAAAESYFFKMAGKLNFTITDSTNSGNSRIYMVRMSGDCWVDENGKLIKCANTGSPTRTILSYYAGDSTFSLKNISIYATSFIQEVWTSGSYNFTIDNCKLYCTESRSTSEPAFYLLSSGKSSLTVTNTFIHNNVNGFVFRQDGSGFTSTFENCDIYVSGGGNTKIPHSTEEVKFINCRNYKMLFDSNYAGQFISDATKAGGNSVFTPFNTDSYNKIMAAIPDGYSVKEASNSYDYTVPSSTTTLLDATTGCPTFTLPTKTVTVSYQYEVCQAVAVEWYHNDALYDTTYVVLGEKAVGPEIIFPIADDHYRNGKYVWEDAEHNSDLTITDATKAYKFYSTEETADGQRGYVASIKGAQISFAYYTQFHMIFYLPVVEGMEKPTVSGSSTGGANIFIDDREYWTYTYYDTVTAVFNDHKCTVNYTVDGESFSKTLTGINGRYYANAVLSNPGYAAEHESVANMVRYVRETLEAVDDKTYDSDIAALIGTDNGDGSTSGGLYDLDAYSTEYNSTLTDVDNYDEFIEFIYFGVPNRDSVPHIYIRLTETAYENGARITKIVAGGVDVGLDGNDRQQCSKNMKVYHAIGTINVTVSVPESAATEDVAAGSFTFTYSLGAYITRLAVGEPNEAYNESLELAKAIYDFGVAADEYRTYVNKSRQ